MAGCIYSALTTAEISIPSTFVNRSKALLKLYSVYDVNIKIKEWGIYFKGVTSTSPPVLCKIESSTTDESDFVAHTPLQIGGPIRDSFVYCYSNCSSDSPATGNTFRIKEVHPQLGYQEKFGPGDEINWGSTGSYNSIVLSVISPTTLECVAEIVFEE